MCIAIYSKIGNDVPKDSILKNCWNANDDGAGFAFNFNGRVEIRKGFMTFEEFITAFHEHDKFYNFKNRGVLLHFRITTHGGTNKQCCHPFPLSSSNKQLKKTKVSCDYAVIHNGIIHMCADTAEKEKTVSDTMVFIRDYLTRISSNKGWFNNDNNFSLIGDLIESKMAILNAKGEIHATKGFSKGIDGNYYSNDSYLDTYRFLSSYSYGYYGFSDYDIDVDGYTIMRLKRDEVVLYDDGTTEEYEADYHEEFPTFISLSGNIYSCYDGIPIGRTIDTNRLSFLGTECFASEKSLYSEDEIKPLSFRSDVTIYNFEDTEDLDWMCG